MHCFHGCLHARAYAQIDNAPSYHWIRYRLHRCWKVKLSEQWRIICLPCPGRCYFLQAPVFPYDTYNIQCHPCLNIMFCRHLNGHQKKKVRQYYSDYYTNTNTIALKFLRLDPLFLFLWLHHHSNPRRVVSRTVWWSMDTRHRHCNDICLHSLNTSGCLCQCVGSNSCESRRRILRSKLKND